MGRAIFSILPLFLFFLIYYGKKPNKRSRLMQTAPCKMKTMLLDAEEGEQISHAGRGGDDRGGAVVHVEELAGQLVHFVAVGI